MTVRIMTERAVCRTCWWAGLGCAYPKLTGKMSIEKRHRANISLSPKT